MKQIMIFEVANYMMIKLFWLEINEIYTSDTGIIIYFNNKNLTCPHHSWIRGYGGEPPGKHFRMPCISMLNNI